MAPRSPAPYPPGAGSPRDARTITKKELVARIAERTNQTKVVAKDIIQMFLDEIIRELGDGNRLEFREFGVFEIKERAARKAQNPRTLEKVDVPAKRVVKFKVGRLMKECVADGEGPIARGDADADGDGGVSGGGIPGGGIPGGGASGGGASGGGAPGGGVSGAGHPGGGGGRDDR